MSIKSQLSLHVPFSSFVLNRFVHFAQRNQRVRLGEAEGRTAAPMLAKAEEHKPGKGKKRGNPGEDGDGPEKKRGGKAGENLPGEGGRKRLDALSVGYFRRVGERLGEGFGEDEERGEMVLLQSSEQPEEGI